MFLVPSCECRLSPRFYGSFSDAHTVIMTGAFVAHFFMRKTNQ